MSKQQSKQQTAFIEANTVTKLIISGMGFMALAFISFCLYWFFPLKEQVAVIDTKVDRIDKTVEGINANLKQVRAESQQKDEEFRAAVTQDTLPSLLKNTTEGSSEELKKTLPRAQHYIAVAREKRLPVNPKTIKDRGFYLLKERKESKDYDIKQQTWQTVSKLAGLKTTASAGSPQLSRVIEESKAKGILFEGGKFTLGVETREGAVFKDCTVVYKGDRVDLKGVYFINCDFEVEPGDAGEQFLRTIFNSSTALVSFSYPVKKPLGASEGGDSSS